MNLGRQKLKEYINIHPRGFKETLARKLGISIRHVNNYLSGKNTPLDPMKKTIEKVSNGFIHRFYWLEDV